MWQNYESKESYLINKIRDKTLSNKWRLNQTMKTQLGQHAGKCCCMADKKGWNRKIFSLYKPVSLPCIICTDYTQENTKNSLKYPFPH